MFLLHASKNKLRTDLPSLVVDILNLHLLHLKFQDYLHGFCLLAEQIAFSVVWSHSQRQVFLLNFS